jgi:geranylgeranyl reductase family protein
VDDVDLIVIGAGPGGSNAAAVALSGGLTVLQLDAARFPRVKPCAGGVTMKARAALRLAIEPSAQRSFHAIEFNVWGHPPNRLEHHNPLLTMVCRPEFDNQLVQQNRRRAAFTLRDGVRATRVEYVDRRFRVETDHGPLFAPQLVAADGAYSVVNRTFRISRPRAMATAIEANIPVGRASATVDQVPCLDYGAVTRGYGWVFPKHDHASVGLYTLAPRVSGLRELLAGYIRAKGFAPPAASRARFEAYRIPVGGFRLRVPRCPVYLVGDAGGFADAMTGEGIYHALESGRIAGEVAVAVARGLGSPRQYYRRLWKPVLRDTALTYACAIPLFRHIERTIGLLEHPLVSRPLIHGASAAATFGDCVLKGGIYLVRSLRSEPGRHNARP